MAKLIELYQQRFAELFNVKHAFAFWKGRVALYAILKAIGVGKDDEVILPGYSCVMDVNPIMYLEARPVYVDIEPNLYNMNLDLLEDKITDRTKAIIALHTYGYPVEMEKLLQIANTRNIPIIEDCCLALGSRYKGRLVGTFGLAAYFSMQWNKPYTTGLGGMLITDDELVADKISRILKEELLPVPKMKALMLALQIAAYKAFIYPRTAAMAQNLYRWFTEKGLVIGSSSPTELKAPEMPNDFFMGISNIQAIVGLRELKRIDKNINHRKYLASLYDKLLTERGWKIAKVPEYMDPVLVRYPIRVRDKWGAIEEASKRGIELGSWFEAPLHPRNTNHDLYYYKWGMCPEAERAAEEVVNLPLHLRVSEKTAIKTVEFIDKYRPE